MTSLQTQLTQFLMADAASASPVYTSMTDAEVAAALNTRSVTVLTPITEVTLIESWGSNVYAVVLATIKAVAAGTTAEAPYAGLLLDMLKGVGIYATDPSVQAQLAGFVSAGVVTQSQATQVLLNFPFGSGVTASTDVTSARTQMAFNAAQQQAYRRAAVGWNAVQAAIGAAPAVSNVPTANGIYTLFSNAVSAFVAAGG